MFLFSGCENDEDMDMESCTMITAKIENISDSSYAFYESGMFNTPDGASEPGPLLPAQSYGFSFEARSGDYLSFATMLVPTNDLFLAPDNMGLKLFNGASALNGDITGSIKLWDAGTEVNEAPFVGMNQPLDRGGNSGSDEKGIVRMVDDIFTILTLKNL